MIYLKNISNFNSVLSFECLDCQFNRVITDTREFQVGDLFVAISGEKFNAFSLIEQIIAQGCECIVFTRNDENTELLKKYQKNFPRIKFIEVSDSINFLQELSKDHIIRLKSINPNFKTISISGSNGKTTCKEMLKHLIESLEMKVVATQRNDNNHLGVPLTLLRVTEQTQVAIVELGSNHPGEIEALFNLFAPDHTYITNIGMTHMEFFPTLDDVFKEEGFPFQHLSSYGKDSQMAWVNMDDSFLARSYTNKAQESLSNFIKIGEAEESFFTTNTSLEIEGERVENLSLLGKYNYHNLGVMLLIAKKLVGIDKSQALLKAARSFKPNLMRSQWLDKEGIKIFLDAYNANPSSMKLAIEGFTDFVKSREETLEGVQIIIGDMNELGLEAEMRHIEIGEYLSHFNDLDIIFVGKYAASYKKGLGALECQLFQSIDELLKQYRLNEQNCKYLFLKASRSLQLERILDNI